MTRPHGKAHDGAMPGAAFTPDQVTAIRHRDDGCLACGTHSNLTTQHRTARGMGGTRRTVTTVDGITLCHKHHMWIEAHPDDARILGWRVDQNSDPAHILVWRHNTLPGKLFARLWENNNTALWTGTFLDHNDEAHAEDICERMLHETNQPT